MTLRRNYTLNRNFMGDLGVLGDVIFTWAHNGLKQDLTCENFDSCVELKLYTLN